MPNFKKLTYLFILAFFLFISGSSSSSVLASTLKISPSSVTKNVGESGEVQVMLDTEGADVYGVEAYINVRGSSVNFDSIEVAGSVNQTELIDSSISSNQIYFAILKPDSVINGVEPVVTLKFSALAGGDTNLTFVTEGNFNVTEVAEVNNPNNVLTSTGPGLISVSNSSAGGGDRGSTTSGNQGSASSTTQNSSTSSSSSSSSSGTNNSQSSSDNSSTSQSQTTSNFVNIDGGSNVGAPGGSTSGQVPATGYSYSDFSLYLYVSLSFVLASLVIKRLFLT